MGKTTKEINVDVDLRGMLFERAHLEIVVSRMSLFLGNDCENYFLKKQIKYPESLMCTKKVCKEIQGNGSWLFYVTLNVTVAPNNHLTIKSVHVF